MRISAPGRCRQPRILESLDRKVSRGGRKERFCAAGSFQGLARRPASRKADNFLTIAGKCSTFVPGAAEGRETLSEAVEIVLPAAKRSRSAAARKAARRKKA